MATWPSMTRHLPNILTVGRLALTIVFLVIILYSPYSPSAEKRRLLLNIGFFIFVIAGLTDIVDGWLARRLQVATRFGRIVDPLADKVLVCGAFVCFAIVGVPLLFNLSERAHGILHWGVAGILIAREAYVTVLRQRAEAQGFNFAATASGKLKMFFQAFAIGTVIVKMGHLQNTPWAYWFTSVVYTAMVGSTIISGIRSTQRKLERDA